MVSKILGDGLVFNNQRIELFLELQIAQIVLIVLTYILQKQMMLHN